MLDISLGMVVFVVVLFLSLIYVLNNMMYGPLMAFMDKREKTIADDEASVSENSDEIAALKEEANSIISEAKSEASEIKSSALVKIKADFAEELESKKSSLEATLEGFVDELTSVRDSLKKDISANIGSYKDSIESKLKNI